MIEIKAESVTQEDGTRGVTTSVSTEGTSEALFNEALSVIKGVMVGLKESDPVLHMAVLLAISEDTDILMGDKGKREPDTREAELAKAMSKSILKKGVN